MSGRVLVLHTGGTIGMARSPDGYRPMPGFGAVLRRQLAGVSGLPAFDLVELPQPIDSANLQPAQWTTIAAELVARWDDYRGFVVLHGTDTMAWTASALSFMLRGADRPVILTGAQVPLVEPRSDALANLQAALVLAARLECGEIGLFFGRRLLRGNRSTKSSSTAFDAFSSPNAPALAEVGIEIGIDAGQLLPAGARDFARPVFDPRAVAVLTVHPGLSARQVDALTDDPALRGLVLCSYGAGNLPDAEPGLIDALARAVARGVVVVNRTQCAHGPVVQGAYATGAALARIGVVPAADMTLESAFAKLHVLLATHADPARVRTLFATALCGEMS
ncbi:asparaginase domain-containing protein [Thauera sp. JM12B12]|uniref:asparaginase domain-containing protein n=1 Tax=Thauera sp. JM12B12 TaxID=3142262 RepID=UPI0031F39470